MEIYQLKTFVTIAREGTITRAADILCLSQPAVSAHIKALEDEIGFSLFERNARGMSLSSQGSKLLLTAERLLGLHRELVAQAKQIRRGAGGQIRLGSNRAPSALLLGKLLSQIAEYLPDVDVHLQYGSSIEIERAIINAELDAGFFSDSGTESDELLKIQVDSFGVYLAAPLGWVDSPANPDWDALAQMPWICPAPQSCCGNVAEGLFLQHKFRPAKQIDVDHEKVTRSLIAGGVGLGLLHADTAMDASEKCELVLLGGEQRKVPVYFSVKAARLQEPLIAAVLERINLLLH
jgi:DNA-binding transcriptional LysR family regulator